MDAYELLRREHKSLIKIIESDLCLDERFSAIYAIVDFVDDSLKEIEEDGSGDQNNRI